MVVSVEEVSSSLVREYLSRKGLKKTIACMDEEHPRTEASINNRSHLRQILNIEALYKKNKVQNSPLKTLLEIIVKHHIDGLKNDKKKSSDVSATLSSPAEMNEAQNTTTITPITLRSHEEKPCPSQPTLVLPKTERISTHSQNASPQDNESSRTRVTDGIQKSRSSRIRRGMMPGPIASTPEELNKKRQMRRAEMPQPLLRREEDNIPSRNGFLVTNGEHQNSSEISAEYMGRRWEVQSAAERMQMENSFEEVGRLHVLQTRKAQSASRPNVTNLNLSELVLDDIDDAEELQDLSTVSLQRAVVKHSCPGRPMDQHTASELKAVLLGSSLNCFSVEWRNQSFTFSETHDLRYGIVQKKGGPCGVLASVQAFVLKNLLFESMESNSGIQRLRPSNTTRRNCLLLAVAEILWRAGEEKQAVIAICSGRKHFIPTGQYKSEGALEKITFFTVDSFKDLQLLLEQHVEQFESGLLGCLLLVISAVLSRSIEKVKEDMDVPTTTLIGAHGYCTQELVNLLLCGQAVSNVFDNDMELDSGNGNMTLLKGMKGPCDIGLLSLFEHYNIVKVGTYLKTPRWPIWVVCSESHFSVLFGLQRELLTNQDKDLEFDLYYYDGLANQQEEIRLTVSVGRPGLSCQNNDADLIPPLEHCIHTRWKDAFVHWNNTEPIL